MKNRFSVVTGGMALLLAVSAVSTAAPANDGNIVAVVENGRVVFKNAETNPPAVIPAAELAVATMPESTSGPINALIESIASKHGVDSALVKAIVKTESNFNRWAVSSKGALGLMQLIPSTGARYGVRDFYDPKQNIEGGVTYLKFLLEKFKGDLDLSLAAYNAGENLVERLGRIPPIQETRDYVRKVRANYGKPAVTVVASTAAPAAVVDETPKIFRSVDERGVVHYSNVDPQK